MQRQRRMFAQPRHDRRRFFGMAALSLAGAWIGTRDSVMHMITVKPFRLIQRQRPGLARWGDRLAQFSATDSGGPAGQGRPRRLLDLHLHQLASHTAIRSRLGRPVQGTRVGRHRRAHTRILVRGRRRQRAKGRTGERRHVPDRHRQQPRDLEWVRQSLLAGALLHRCDRARARSPLRRRQLRRIGNENSTIAGSRRKRRRDRS